MWHQAGLVLLLVACLGSAEQVRNLQVSEGAPIGTRVGFIGDGTDSPPYLIVPVPGSAVESDLKVETNTGEILTKVNLDRETRSSYSFVAIPRSGKHVRVVIKVLDENDNAPTFLQPFMEIEFPENTPKDVKRTLSPAKDLDLGIFNTKSYNIVSGNVDNAFQLSYHIERDGVLYLDLQVHGPLDRETTSQYSLVIEALDGGTPPLRGTMTVNVTIQDVNDNQPLFNQTRYFAQIPENATVGTSVIRVTAYDLDAGDNGKVEYSINRRQSDRDGLFRIDPETGLIAVNRPLDFETKEVHELVVVARDRGAQPLETTTFVSITVTDVNDNQPIINVIFLSDDATPKISEGAQRNEFVARISVSDPDSKAEYSNVNVTLEGGDGHFGLATFDNIIYLVVLSMPLDREQKPNYTLTVVATDTGTPPLHASTTFDVRITDVNDNPPQFSSSLYHANVLEVADPGTSVFQIIASDRDDGINAELTYSIQETTVNHPPWFQIDSKSGLITTKSHIDCETEPVPKLIVIATDGGSPSMSASATVLVTIHDVNDNEPIFEQTFYNATFAENEPKGRCILKVSASDPDCGVNAMVNYTLGQSASLPEFEVRSLTGDVCIAMPLDFETRSTFEFTVVATDRGGLSTTAAVKIQLTDVNDNLPVFYPKEYNVSLRESDLSSVTTSPVVVVAASDLDSGRFGTVSYRISSGNQGGLFRIDSATGEIYVVKPGGLSSSMPGYRLSVSAIDGGGLKSAHDAQVFISVTNARSTPPHFERSRYTFTLKEDSPLQSTVGLVKATNHQSGGSAVRYAISSGDPDGYFSIDPLTGIIRTASHLDHEAHPWVLLNVQAIFGSPPVYGHAQVQVVIEDVNDNPPEFGSTKVRISVPESAEPGGALYVAHARDPDSGANGRVTYRLIGTDSRQFGVDPSSGRLSLASRLDFETAQRHTLVIAASDGGDPPLAANLTLLLEVQDVNDNPPVFERSEYSAVVAEDQPLNTKVVQVTAVDLDTGNNARLTYRLLSTDPDDGSFGIFPNSGWIYLKRQLDRESQDRYTLRITATDNGAPSATATALVGITVTDANDNDPTFPKETYHMSVEENLPGGALVGRVKATDPDQGPNAALRYSLIPANSTFHIDPVSGEVRTRVRLDRESRAEYEIVAEARDQGSPSRSGRAQLKISVLDVNDNAPDLVDPQEDVVSVREEQPAGTQVVRVRAVDKDAGSNASVTYSIIKGREADGWGVFSIDPITGVLKTKVVLDHGERPIYRVAVAATDAGSPPRQSVRTLRVEVLALNDNRPTFTSSSLHFKVREDVGIGYVVGSVVGSEGAEESLSPPRASGGHVTYTLTSVSPSDTQSAFDLDRSSGSLVVARKLDRETVSEYRLEVRALDTSTTNNPQSSAVLIKVEVVDVNDNPPQWDKPLITLDVAENLAVGSSIWNLTASDIDSSPNGDVRYSLVEAFPKSVFSVDRLTGSLLLTEPLDFEQISTYTLVLQATDQAVNQHERLSSSLTAKLKVHDVNDNAPKFTSSSSTVFVKDHRPGDAIHRVQAIDLDAGENARITYAITGGNQKGVFALDFNTGVISLVRSMDPLAKYVLNITATDHGSPPLQSSISLTFAIQRTSEAPPKFSAPEYRANVSEAALPGTFVLKVQASSTSHSGLGNLSYHLGGRAQGSLSLDTSTGDVIVTGPLDRETQEELVVPVFASSTDGWDEALLRITIEDANDHPPKFLVCYPLRVPENTAFAPVHTLRAVDPDLGPNGHITYSISGGNTGNRFSIDADSGELSVGGLDRELVPRYNLVITASDRGSPSLQGFCNLTVWVDDLNDNNPSFEESSYSARVSEDSPPDTSVIRVKARDPDLGPNAKITYSLVNGTHWLFRIDNKTGIIYTAGWLDRERMGSYDLVVMATDSGRYETRSASVSLRITITDINDNKPTFTQYPFLGNASATTQPGQDLVQALATDPDLGPNAELVFSLVPDPGSSKFRIHPRTGVVSSAASLASDSGRVFRLKVIATDKGNPPQSSVGLVEIKVGQSAEAMLRFQNSSYDVQLDENSFPGTNVLQVSAVRTDGRRQNITYSFGAGNEDDKFDIDSETGLIRVMNSDGLDYESTPVLNLVVVARADVPSPMYGYCDIKVQLMDRNDNAPRFTQQQYSASVLEGNSKGTFIMQVAATDLDQGSNSRLLYHIVDGNHDNAFIIEPPFSGVVKTNIVLDREIRDTYRLTVIATDEGVPQLTGTATIRINIVDVNDNQPTFPPHSVIFVNEGKAVGSVLTAVTANDVDTNPALTYSLAHGENDLAMFSVDRFSGKVTLCKPLDFEHRKEYHLHVTASDTAHEAQTVLTVTVTDDNDNAPVFERPSYFTNLPENIETGQSILTVSAKDADWGQNAEITYSLDHPVPGFNVNARTGAITVNRSAISIPEGHGNVVNLVVKATDGGTPPLSSWTSVRVKVDGIGSGLTFFTRPEFRVSINENTAVGKSILVLAPGMMDKLAMKDNYRIVDGNVNSTFQVSSPSGDLVLAGKLDRELKDSYRLRVEHLESSAVVYITVEDANDNAPQFSSLPPIVTISEGSPIGTSILQVKCTDDDLPPNSDIQYALSSGNDLNFFSIDPTTGVLSVKSKLDYDSGTVSFSLVVRATDRAKSPELPLSSVAILHINLEDENDNAPVFPVAEYLEFVGENEAVGAQVFIARATDMDLGNYGKLNYSIESAAVSGFTDLEDSWKLFRVDPTTGLVSTNSVFDYETRSRYAFTLKATDSGGRSAKVRVQVEIESKDEFHPQFTERTYKFVLSGRDLPVGFLVGQVTATDRDKGPDGRVVYQLSNQHPYFKVNRTTGAVTLKKKIDGLDASQEISFVITASSGRQGSLTNMTVVEISLDPLSGLGTNRVEEEEGAALSGSTGGVADWAMGLLITLILVILSFGAVFLLLHVRNRRHKKGNKPGLGAGQPGDPIDPGAFDTIPIRGIAAGPTSQFGPPKYEEIQTYRNSKSTSSNSGAATSQLSGSEQSGSSGRGSAEDGDDVEDEEIRMINEGVQRDAALHRNSEDNLSDVSVHNTKEYLARLGIVNTGSSRSRRHPESVSGSSNKDMMLPIDGLFNDVADEGDITNLIYSKLSDNRSERGGEDASSSAGARGGKMGRVPPHQPSVVGSLSSVVHSEEEIAGSYRWDYLLDWGPQYQPLAHVFSEIARLKDDAASVKSGASGTSSGKGKCPPHLTSVAPRSVPPHPTRQSHPKHHILARSPIQDNCSGVFSPSAPLSPSFSPALSPLATSPSLSPIVSPRLPPSHHPLRQRTKDTELRV